MYRKLIISIVKEKRILFWNEIINNNLLILFYKDAIFSLKYKF